MKLFTSIIRHHITITFSILPVFVFLLSGCGSSTSGWKQAQSMNTIEAYEEFLKSNPTEELAAMARGKIDTLTYLRTKEEHTLSSYERYLRQFPNGTFFDEAQTRLEKLYFYQRAEIENSISGYDDFLARFPNGAFAAEARSRREKLYFNQQISKEHTIASYESYLQQYPDGAYADSARSRIERLSFDNVKTTDSVSIYLDYLKKYPDGAFKAEALSRIELSAFREANKTRSIDAYEKYIRQYPQGIYVAAARHSIATQLEAYQQGKVVRVSVKELFYQKNQDGSKTALTGVSLPIESIARRLLSEHANVTAVGPDAKSYSTTLTIQTEGIALGKDYGTDSMHYTGASFTGSLSLETIGYPPFKRMFNVSLEPPLSSKPVANGSNGASAPFAKVMKAQDSFLPKLIEVLYKIYGTQALLSSMRDADESVRSAALDICGAFKIDNAFNSVVNALRDNNFSVRERASLALGLYKDDQAVDPLIRNLQEVLDFDWIKDESNSAREKAAVALGMIGSPKATKALIAALKDPSADVRRETSLALKKITSQDFGEDQDAWTKWSEQQTKK